MADKGCINQTNIKEDLRCLPVFLSGCQSMIVLTGTSYATRLWCVLEIFVFLRMGGTHERLHVYSLGGKEVERALLSFDALKAQCFLKGDRERLLGVIEAAFGDCKPFNKLVRGILTHKGEASQPQGSDLEAPMRTRRVTREVADSDDDSNEVLTVTDY